ncbi:NepR family anti-sigma factor [Microvirga arabica]|uniref:NepR family anti-sigma factor n=1 Tax=Microvirga arabica TaxID=1128671 RepID=UPI001FE9906B|nr:NepR family anti-sigma factor [Microvirga arabica]
MLENEYMDTAKVGYPGQMRGGKGTNMTVDKGNKLARASLDNGSGEKLATDPKLDSGSQKRIGDQLRAMYDELMQQPVPDRFRDLLDQLDKSGQKGGSQ